MSGVFDLASSNEVSSRNIKRQIGKDEDIESYLMRMINLSEDGIFHDQNCPICCSGLRKKAEKEWSDSRNGETVRQIFADSGERYSVQVIKHHMENHFGGSGAELKKKEYIHKLSLLNSSDTSTLSKLEMTLTALNERLVAINAIEDPEMPASTVEKIKSDQTCKISSTMEKLLRFRADMLGEMKNHGEVFTIDKSAFVKLFETLLNECSTSNERAWINRVFSSLSSICKEY